MQTFFIIDDDLGIRRMLENIIMDYSLGTILGEAGDGLEAIKEIERLKPDIVLVDLLLPSVDGIEIVKKVKEMNRNIQFVMISEVKSKDMVGEAYQSGIEFFINKPLNVVEVVSVIEKIMDSYNLKKALKLIEGTIKRNKRLETKTKKVKPQLIKVLSELGILGETGSKDLINLIDMIIQERQRLKVKVHSYKIGELYLELTQKYEDEYSMNISVKALEQRIRRIVQSAFVNMASIGLDDYTNFKFERYASTLFDFKEIRKEMLFINKKASKAGKINIKKFIEGIIGCIEF